MPPENEPAKSPLTVPLAIVIAGGLIAGAIFLSRTPNTLPAKNNPNEIPAATNPAPSASAALGIRAVDTSDHIRGNPDAPIVIVEYSDTECPFCRIFHETLRSIIEAYGKSGRVAWVYRHFPIPQLHSKAAKEAEAFECAAEVGGNLKFWEYADRLFAITPSNDGLDPAELPRIAEFVKLNRAAWESCYQSGRHGSRVERDRAEAVAVGGNGTPYSILVLKQAMSERTMKRVAEINADLLRRLPPGSENPLIMSADGLRLSVGGAFQLPLMKEIINLLLKDAVKAQ